MMHRNYRIVLSLAATLLLAGALPASATTPTGGVAADSATGCLQKGDKPDMFKLVSKDGKSLDVWSKKISLAGHVGHTVTLTGDVKKSDMSGMKDSSMSKMGDSSSMAGMGSSGGGMDVTAMKMVSGSCS